MRRGRHDGVTTAGVRIDEPPTSATAQPRTRSPAARRERVTTPFKPGGVRTRHITSSRSPIPGATASSEHRERRGARRASASAAPLQSSGSGSGKPIKKLAATAIKYRGDAQEHSGRGSRGTFAAAPNLCRTFIAWSVVAAHGGPPCTQAGTSCSLWRAMVR